MATKAQVQNFVSTFQAQSTVAIRALNNLQEILSYGQANKMLGGDGITPEDLAGSSLEGMSIEALMTAVLSVAGIVTYLNEQQVYGAVAPILEAPAL